MKKPRKDEEHKIQCAIIEAVQYIPECRWLYAIPNGGYRNIATAVRLKKEGVKPGVLDLFLPVPIVSKQLICHGLYIEVKTTKPGSRLTENQKEFIEHCDRYGYVWKIVRSAQECVVVINRYLELKLRLENEKA